MVFGGFWLSLLALNVLFNVAALIGGFLIARLLVSIPASLFFSAVVSAITPIDILAFALKTLLGGLGIFLIACYHGMSVGRSAPEVPIAVSRASLNALVFLVMLHAVVSLSVIFYTDAGNLLSIVI